MSANRTPVPLSFFSIPVGLLAFANTWHVGARLWHLPADVATALTLAGLATWVVLLALYAHKWLARRADAVAELQHPLQSSFAALLPVASMLAAAAIIPWAREFAQALFVVTVAFQLAVGLWLNGRMWMGGRPPELVTPAAYLPGVAQSFVAATVSAAFGWNELGLLFFGAGLFAWLATESVILHRASTGAELPAPLRPLLGIQLAPPVVGGGSWMALTTGAPDLFAFLLLGYGVYQALLLLRLLPWIRRQAFVPAYWAFSFGTAALPALAMRLVDRGATGLVADLAPALFVVANAVFAILVVRTLALLGQGRLLPVAAPVAA